MSKLQRLRDNISAIESALKGENDRDKLAGYSGFGGLDFILKPQDKSEWTKSDLPCYEDTMRLRRMLADSSKDEQEFSQWWQSLKQSTLTAFYTPHYVAFRIMMAISEATICSDRMGNQSFRSMLDPAAGNGVFGSTAWYHLNRCTEPKDFRMVCYEKDLLSGLILSGSRPEYDVRVDGFETIPEEDLGRFDLVATNVPFGDTKVFDAAYTNSDSQVRREAARMIHRYYVLKGLDCLRDGGLLAYIITSNYINNDSGQLREALKQSRLIGAYRLANDLFKESGTEVGTDLLVLQKDLGKGGLTEEEKALLDVYEEGGCKTPRYFFDNEDHVIATSWTVGTDAYGKRAYEFRHRSGVTGIADQLGKQLEGDMRKFDAVLFGKGREAAVRPGKKETRKKLTTKEALLKAMSEQYTKLYAYEQKERKEDKDLRGLLNQTYDRFVSIYGYLNHSNNRKDVERIAKDLLALEVKGAGGEWQKADILLKPVAFRTDEVEVMTGREALAASLNRYGRINMADMEEWTGKTADELYEELRGEIFWNPLEDAWEVKAKFVCGNVVEKIARIETMHPELKEAIEDGGQYQEDTPIKNAAAEALRALYDAVPEPIPFEDLDFNLGERWVDPRIYADFASEFFSMPEDPENSWRGGKAVVTVKLAVDQYVASATCHNERIRTQFSVTSETGNRLDGIDLLQHALNDTTPKLMRYKRNARGAFVMTGSDELAKEEDPEAVQSAKEKITQIREGYVSWLQRQPRELRDSLAAEYNRRFNCFVRPKYDGSHQTFPDLDMEGLRKKYGIGGLYGSQKDAVWMIKCLGGGVCDHEVGSGKTLIMCIAAHEMKRLGMVHKPMIIGMKANVSAIAETYRTCYPDAKVLFATEADYSASRRVDFFNRMKTGDWDCVIMSHSQFGMIPQSEEVEREVTFDRLRQVEDALEAVSASEGWEISNKMRKGLEKRKSNLQARMQALNEAIRRRKDDVVNFEMMGIDMLFVDEYHEFKNLRIETRHDRVAGLGGKKDCQRAQNLLVAVRTIQRRRGRDLGAVFLSGTVVSNSLSELYTLFSYLRPRALESQGITCFDAWAAIFCQKTAEFEFGVANNLILKERFRRYVKVPELGKFYHEITDCRTAEEVGIERPTKNLKLLLIDPTPDQEVYIKTLLKFAQTGDFRLIGIDHPTDAQRTAKMLYATNMARKMSLDMRLIDPKYGDHPNSKASRCAEIVSRFYHTYDDMKGTQLVFSDLSTYQDKNHWCVYQAIKDKLVDEYGIPAGEIRFIQEAKSDKAKQQMIDDMNEGKIRVLFGSTTMLGTGVNAQKRVVAVHHLDTPWRPSDLEQRDGRAVRKGNEVAEEWADNRVMVIVYAVKRSLDAYKFHLLHLKQVFIHQTKCGNIGVRTVDEGAMDEKSGMAYAEFASALSGNTDIKDRCILQKRIAALEGERKNFYRERHSQEEKHEWYVRQGESHKRNAEAARQDWERYLAARTVIGGEVLNDLEIDGFATGEPKGSDAWTKLMARELVRIDNDTVLNPGEYRTVGSIYGFPVVMRTELSGVGMDGVQMYQNHFMVQGSMILHTSDNGKLPRRSFADTAGYFLSCLELIPERVAAWESASEAAAAHVAQLEEIMKAEWGKDAQLAEMKQQLTKLDEKIARSIGKTDEELLAQAQSGKTELPYKFERDRGDYTVSFKRSLLSLIPVSEMRSMADDISYRSRVYDWSSYGRWDPDRDIEVEFSNPNYPDTWILKALDLQRRREKDASWLADKASEDTGGTAVTQDNETIFAARAFLKGMRQAA